MPSKVDVVAQVLLGIGALNWYVTAMRMACGDDSKPIPDLLDLLSSPLLPSEAVETTQAVTGIGSVRKWVYLLQRVVYQAVGYALVARIAVVAMKKQKTQ